MSLRVIQDYMFRTVESVSLTDVDMRRMSKNLATIHEYSVLGRMKNAGDLFQGKKYAIILYETKKGMGHWCCVINRADMYYFFDPYGFKLDEEISFVKPNLRKYLGEDVPHLTILLSDKKVISNPVQYQKVIENVNTCGRHCISKILWDNDGLSDKDYFLLFQNMSDFLVSIQTKFL